jgi:glycosyltransferase involved in cell wall biosynthesis
VETSRADALGDALVGYLADTALQTRLRARARGRAAHFSWDRAARDTLEVYRRYN